MNICIYVYIYIYIYIRTPKAEPGLVPDAQLPLPQEVEDSALPNVDVAPTPLRRGAFRSFSIDVLLLFRDYFRSFLSAGVEVRFLSLL